MSRNIIAGLKVIAVSPSKVHPNEWNPNEMNEETFRKEVASIQENGFIDPITVRVRDDGEHEIVDGEHRVKAALHLKLDTIPAIDLGNISVQQAKKLTIISNELKGKPVAAKMALLVSDLLSVQPVEELVTTLPFTAAEIGLLNQTVQPFAWPELPKESTKKQADDKPVDVATGAEHRRVSIGSIAGTVPAWLVNALGREFQRTANAVHSTSIEAVFGDWLKRLAATEPEVNQTAASQPKTSAKGGRKKAATQAP